MKTAHMPKKRVQHLVRVAGTVPIVVFAAAVAVGCTRAPFAADATELLSAGKNMELVRSFAVREYYDGFDFRPTDEPQVFFPSLRGSPPQFGLFVHLEGSRLTMTFADQVISQTTGDIEDITALPERSDFVNSDIATTGFFVAQRTQAFTTGTGLDGDLYFSYMLRDNDVDLEILVADPNLSTEESTVWTDRLTRLFDEYRSIDDFVSPDPRGLAVGTGAQAGVAAPVFVLFNDEGTWRIVEQEISGDESDPFGPSDIRTDLDAAAPDIPGPTTGSENGDITRVGVLHVYEPDGTNPTYVFISLPDETGFFTLRQVTPDGASEGGAFEPLEIDRPIVSVLSNERLLVRSGSHYHIYGFDGRRTGRFRAGRLRFVHERPVDGRWYSYFSGSYWGRLGDSDYVFFRIYRVPTDELHRQ